MKEWLTKYRALALPPLLLYTWFAIQTAWSSDDAYITFRSIENFIHGYGPVYNVGERVQTFTHPLWFLVQSAANLAAGWWEDNPLGRGQMYYLNIFISLALSLFTLAILTFRVASSTRSAVLGILILSVSKAFVDYSTSGLENPLTHAIVIVFIWLLFAGRGNLRSRIFTLSALAALGGLNRLDTFTFFLPAIGLLFLQSTEKRKTLLAIAFGLLPLFAWLLFSLFYYGTPFPNTAFAKINTGISTMSLIRQGTFYFLNSLRLDPITLLVVFAGTISGLVIGNDLHRSVMAGVLLYLLYILYIGGDFMSGRYFSAPLLASTAVLSNLEFKSMKSYGLSLGMVLLIGVAPIYVVPERRPSFGSETGNYRVFLDEHRISDERRIYSRYGLGLLRSLKDGAPRAPYTRENWIFHAGHPVQVELVGPLGLAGYGFGPDVHVIDLNGLADALMARMPLKDPGSWRIGHFRHVIPEGYLETLAAGENLIVDENIALYYDKLAFVIKGDLWSWPRLVEIWNLNTGKYDYLLERTASGQE